MQEFNTLKSSWDFQLDHIQALVHSQDQEPLLEFVQHPELELVQEVKIHKICLGELWKNRYHGKWTPEPRSFRTLGWEMDPLLLEFCDLEHTPKPMPLHTLQNLIRDRIIEIRQSRIAARNPTRQPRVRGSLLLNPRKGRSRIRKPLHSTHAA